jgi:hypothetical protein
MQAALRSALQEAARGVSTAIVVWAGQQPNHCSCSCPEQPRCPDCICQGGARVAERAADEGYSLSAVILAWLLGAIAGAAALRFSTLPCWATPARHEPSSVGVSLEDEAAEQRRQLKQRRHESGRLCAGEVRPAGSSTLA